MSGCILTRRTKFFHIQLQIKVIFFNLKRKQKLRVSSALITFFYKKVVVLSFVYFDIFKIWDILIKIDICKVQVFWKGPKKLIWCYWVNVKPSGIFFSNFWAFLQYLNFISHKVKIVHEVNSGSQTQEILLTWG